MTPTSKTLLPERRVEIHASAPARISMMGSRAWLIEAPGAFDLPAQRRIWSMAQNLQQWPAVESLIPGVTNLLVLLHDTPEEPTAVERRLHEYWLSAQALNLEGRQIDIPVVLRWRTRHRSRGGMSAYWFFRPGSYSSAFAGGLYRGRAWQCAGVWLSPWSDPRLATPRKKVPSLNMLKGTVTIGGPQAGVSVLTGPNGWNAIGYAEIEVFNPHAAIPALMAPGDIIRFLPERVEL